MRPSSRGSTSDVVITLQDSEVPSLMEKYLLSMKNLHIKDLPTSRAPIKHPYLAKVKRDVNRFISLISFLVLFNN